MAATITDLGARVLRRLGIAIVAANERPGPGGAVPPAAIAERALRMVGVNPVPVIAYPGPIGVVPIAEIALRALHNLGVNPIAAAGQPFQEVTTYPAETVAVRVLDRLGVVAHDEAPLAVDILAVAAKVRALHADLNAKGIVYWLSSAVPEWAVEQYVIMAAQLAGPAFDKGNQADMTLYAAAQEVLRLQALSGRPGDALAQDRVRFVHDALRAQGVVSWNVTDIPMAYAEDYVKLTAIALAPVYGKPADLAAAAAIEARIFRAGLTGERGQILALEKVLAVHDALNAQGIVDWNVSAIPLAQAEDYVLLTANLLAPIYGKPVSDPAGMEARIRNAAMLRRAPALAEQAVLDVHAGLDARGKTRWTVFDIPDFAEDPYVVLAANKVAPQFGMPADMAAEMRAVRELAQVISLRSSGERTMAEYF